MQNAVKLKLRLELQDIKCEEEKIGVHKGDAGWSKEIETDNKAKGENVKMKDIIGVQ
jgi:hypothetical protein